MPGWLGVRGSSIPSCWSQRSRRTGRRWTRPTDTVKRLGRVVFATNRELRFGDGELHGPHPCLCTSLTEVLQLEPSFPNAPTPLLRFCWPFVCIRLDGVSERTISPKTRLFVFDTLRSLVERAVVGVDSTPSPDNRFSERLVTAWPSPIGGDDGYSCDQQPKYNISLHRHFPDQLP